jgi:hypothetical protein
MDSKPDAGGLGVKMLDGSGKLLPESKRGLPTPETSFYKITGLYKLFPKSSKFNRYYLGHLGYDSNNEIEILSGAFMLMRKETLNQVGLLDEQFFMYGEDIDLSWRIIQGGWKNYYFADTSIIHYKGESTKKGSLNYVYVFYNAMGIFAKKHFSKGNASLFFTLIQLAIWGRASISFIKRIISKLALPVLDFVSIYFVIQLAAYYYSNWQIKNFDFNIVQIYSIIYCLLLTFALHLNGAYDEPKKIKPTLVSVFWTGLISLIAYSILPESIRFSRIVILFSSIFALIFLPIWHRGLFFIFASKKRNSALKRKIFILGSPSESRRIEEFLVQTKYNFTSLEKGDELPESIHDFINVHKINEIIFCAKDVSSQKIIRLMGELNQLQIEFKIAPPESLFIVGSQNIQSATGSIFVPINNITSKLNTRQKRTFDVIFACLLLTVSPLLLYKKSHRQALKNIPNVLLGLKSWIGYVPGDNLEILPKIQKGVFTPASQWELLSSEGVTQLNTLYAKDYSWWTDLKSMLGHLS